MSLVELSVVVPAYNEAESLSPLVGEIVAAVSPIGLTWETVVVDDGSSDSTREVLRELRRERPWLRAVALDRNSGQSAALEAGFRAAAGGLIVTLDADLQNDPVDIPAMLETMRTDRADMVIGIRVARMDSLSKKVQSKIGNAVRNWITGDDVTDTGCSLKLFRRECVEGVNLFRGMHRFLPTLARMRGFHVVERPVSHRPRRFGVSKYGMMNRALRGLADCLAVRWMSRRMTRYRASEITD